MEDGAGVEEDARSRSTVLNIGHSASRSLPSRGVIAGPGVVGGLTLTGGRPAGAAAVVAVVAAEDGGGLLGLDMGGEGVRVVVAAVVGHFILFRRGWEARRSGGRSGWWCGEWGGDVGLMEEGNEGGDDR